MYPICPPENEIVYLVPAVIRFVHVCLIFIRCGLLPSPTADTPAHSSAQRQEALKDAMESKDDFQLKQAKEKGNAAFMAQDFEKAVYYFGKGLKIDQYNEVFWSNRSAAYCSLKEYEKALEDAEQAIALKPGWAKAYTRKAAALHGLQRYEESIEAYKKGLEIDPNSVQLQKALETVQNEFKKAPKRQKTPEREERFMTPTAPK